MKHTESCWIIGVEGKGKTDESKIHRKIDVLRAYSYELMS
jgi:hypothetical protein